jgi:23S rRNA (adenine2503-C2)-methyltransferase
LTPSDISSENTPRINLLDLDRQGMQRLFADLGEQPFRAVQLMKWIYHHGVDDFSAMTNLSKALREKLARHTHITLPPVSHHHLSADGSRKWLLQVDEHNSIETVFIPDGGRGTLCVSSQVGCTLACSFCSTGRQGFNRNLTTAEIIGQVVVAYRALGIPANKGERRITNIVLMGMGEPLLNFANVVRAIELMQEDNAFGISKRRVTLSTAGVVPALDELLAVTDISLAVSLHAPDDELRNQLVPINRKYPIAELLAACQRYIAGKPHRRVTIEYTLIAGVNDSEQQAHALARLLRDLPCKVNLIPFNPFSGSGYNPPGQSRVERFRDIIDHHGLVAVIRRTRGDDIAAACGQLKGDVFDRTRRTLSLPIREEPIKRCSVG